MLNKCLKKLSIKKMFSKKMLARHDGAALVEFAFVISLMVLMIAGITDIALSIIARQQVNSVATVATFYVAQKGDISKLSEIGTVTAEANVYEVSQVIPSKVYGLGAVTVSARTRCGCYVDDPAITISAVGATCTKPTTTCAANFSSTPISNTIPPSFYGSPEPTTDPGIYAHITATGQYSVIFPYIWSVLTPLTDGKLLITVNSYVRIG